MGYGINNFIDALFNIHNDTFSWSLTLLLFSHYPSIPQYILQNVQKIAKYRVSVKIID